MAHGGGLGVDDYLQGFSKLSIKGNVKMVLIAKGKRGKPLSIPEELYNKLYDYQKEGVRWLFDLYEKGKGGILGDDMGLGKTVQMLSFLSGMIECKLIKCALIIAPMSVINVWCTSFKEFSPRTNIATFHGEKRARDKALERIQDRGGVLITTYDLVGREGERLGRDGYNDEFTWDYVVADEGHQLKNKSIKRSQGAHAVPTRYRVILTGTPLQNKLPELWALFDWTHFGQLLGTVRTFNANYGNAIEDGRKKCASAHARALGNEFAESLRKIIEPYLLRRTKEEVGMNNRPASTISQNRALSSASDGSAPSPVPRQMMPSLPRKNDLVVWLTLSKEQEDIYRRFLTTDEVKYLLDPSVKTSPLTQLIVLKKLCDHPRLLSEAACQTLGITFDRNIGEQQAEQINVVGGSLARLPQNQDGDQEIDDLSICIDQSIKTAFLKTLLPQLVNEGHKVLVFSMSLKMLNVVAQILKSRLGIKFLRLDGQVTKLETRQAILEKYQTSDKYKVLLLTTQVGGVGLTITAADRVVIVDPAWNPAVDSQAVDRVYRVGQKRNVVIYRLITAGTVEEKIYRRQVFKVSIFKQIAHSSKTSLTSQSTSNADDPMRYFTHQDLKELFKLGDTKSSDTHTQLERMHAHQRNSDPELDEHINFVTHLPGVVGISDHDLLFTKPEEVVEVENAEENARTRQMVERAKLLIEQESRNPGAGGDPAARVRQPFNERQPDPPGALYPRGFGESKLPSQPKFPELFPSRPDMMNLPTDVPLYLQKKGLFKPGQKEMTPPRLIGRGQKEQSFNLHRSFSDAEVNNASVEEEDDDVIVVEDNNDAPVPMEDNDDTRSLDESSMIRSNRNRAVRPRIEDDDESGSSKGRPNSGASQPRTASTESGSMDEYADAAEPEVINLDSDDDVQVVEHREEPVSARSNHRDSIIMKPRKGARRIIDDDDEEDEGAAVASPARAQSNVTASPPTNVIVIDEDGNEEPPRSGSLTNSRKLSRNGAPMSDTPSFTMNMSVAGHPPLIHSTPFNPGSLALKSATARQGSFPSNVMLISPLVAATSKGSTLSVGSANASSKHGVKRNSHDRSKEDTVSRNQSTNIVGESVLVSDEDGESTEEYDDERTGSTSETVETVPDDENTQEGDDEEAEVVDETPETEQDDDEEELEDEEGSDNRTEDDSNIFKTANHGDTTEDTSRISLQPNEGDTSFAY